MVGIGELKEERWKEVDLREKNSWIEIGERLQVFMRMRNVRG